jgi:hypothetical protein
MPQIVDNFERNSFACGKPGVLWHRAAAGPDFKYIFVSLFRRVLWYIHLTCENYSDGGEGDMILGVFIRFIRSMKIWACSTHWRSDNICNVLG